jgi:hypothetical protein
MDAERFDRLASSIAFSVTRRRAVEGILAGMAALPCIRHGEQRKEAPPQEAVQAATLAGSLFVE